MIRNVIFWGHGEWDEKDGRTTVPAGCTLFFFARHNESIQAYGTQSRMKDLFALVTNDIENRVDWLNSDAFKQMKNPGIGHLRTVRPEHSLVRNYRLFPPDGLPAVFLPENCKRVRTPRRHSVSGIRHRPGMQPQKAEKTGKRRFQPGGLRPVTECEDYADLKKLGVVERTTILVKTSDSRGVTLRELMKEHKTPEYAESVRFLWMPCRTDVDESVEKLLYDVYVDTHLDGELMDPYGKGWLRHAPENRP